MSWKKVLTYVVFFGVGVVLFIQLLAMVEDKGELLENMASAPWWAIAITFIMGFIAIISRGIRWLILLEPMGYKASRFRAVCAVAFGYFANTFVPRSGEVVRCAALSSTDNIPVNKLFGTVITERVVDFIMLLIFMIVALLTNFDAVLDLLSHVQLPKGTTLIYSAIGLVLVVVILIILIRRSSKSDHPIQVKIADFATGIGHGVKSVLSTRRRGAFIAHTLLIWIMYFLMSYSLFKSMNGVSDIDLFDALWVMVSGGFGMIIPAPGGMGSYHWAVSLGFESLGYERALGFAVANVVWITQTAMIIITGGLSYFVFVIHRIRHAKTK